VGAAFDTGASGPHDSRRAQGNRVIRHRSTSLVPVELLLVVGTLISALTIWVGLSSGMYSDFVVWYEAARALREGRELYFTDVTNSGWRNMNPPQMVVLMAPLAWLSIRDALITWWLVTAAAMFGSVRLWREALPRKWPVALFALLLVSASGYLNIRAGNQSWVIAWARAVSPVPCSESLSDTFPASAPAKIATTTNAIHATVAVFQCAALHRPARAARFRLVSIDAPLGGVRN